MTTLFTKFRIISAIVLFTILFPFKGITISIDMESGDSNINAVTLYLDYTEATGNFTNQNIYPSFKDLYSDILIKKQNKRLLFYTKQEKVISDLYLLNDINNKGLDYFLFSPNCDGDVDVTPEPVCNNEDIVGTYEANGDGQWRLVLFDSGDNELEVKALPNNSSNGNFSFDPRPVGTYYIKLQWKDCGGDCWVDKDTDHFEVTSCITHPDCDYLYTVSDSDDKLLYMPKDGSAGATEIGSTGVDGIEAIVISLDEQTLYAANDGTFGTLNWNTGAFTPIGDFGTGNGSEGSETFDDVDGLAFDPSTGILYGSNRRGGDDLLFQINPNTGAFVPGAFGGDDYVVIATTPAVGLDDVDDLAIDPSDGQMYATVNHSSGADERLVKINKNTGAVTDIGRLQYSGGDLDDLEGLSFHNDGNFYGSTGYDGPSETDNTAWIINVNTAYATKLHAMDIYADYESIVGCVDAGPVPPTSSSCNNDSFLWDNNIQVDDCNVTSNSGALCSGCGATQYTIPGPYPAEFSGAVYITISEAISWDGYCGRSNTGDQSHEQWRVVFLKNGNVVHTSSYTQDGIDTGVESDDWVGALDGQFYLPNGTDEIIIAHYDDSQYGDDGGTGDSVYPSSICMEYVEGCNSLPVPSDWDFTCDDYKRVDIYADGTDNCDGNPDSHIDIPNSGNVYQTVVEVVYKNAEPTCVHVFDQDNNSYDLEETYASNVGSYVYSGILPQGNYSSIYTNAQTNGSDCGSGWGLQSLTVYAYRNITEKASSTGTFTDESGYNNIVAFNIPIHTDIGPRDIDVVLPISELSTDGRYLTVTASAGGASASTTIFGPDPNLNSCCINLVKVTVPNVPGSSTSMQIEVDTRNGQYPGDGSLEGQSWVMAGAVNSEAECAEFDYGDNPSSYGEISVEIYNLMELGNSVDEESGMQYSTNADGDDNDGNDDDDGVTFVGGNTFDGGTTKQITISWNTDNVDDGFISGWIDWNGDGDFDSNEQIIDDYEVGTIQGNPDGSHTFDISVPSNVNCGISYARFIIETDQGAGPTGTYLDGEVEDYQVVLGSGVVANAGQDKEICNSDCVTLNATATGGTSPYTYSWDHGLGNGAFKTVCPTSTTKYTVTVTDEYGCTDTDDVWVTVNDNPNALMSKTDAHCQQSDGSATVTASGGTPPYSYHWNTNATTSTINNIPAGTYSVTVTDDKGCEAYGSITVNDLSGPDVTATASPSEICEGYDSDLHATATGGTSPYTYSWDHGLGNGADKTVSPGATTTYHVTVTDAHGCTASTSVTVTVNDNPNALMSKTDAHCQQSDGSATVTASGGTPPYSYHWNTNAITSTINNIPAGTYSVTVTDDKGCEAYGSITVNDLSGPDITATASPSEICKGYDSDLHATATGGTSPYIYSWDHGLGSGADKTVSPGATTTYHVTVTDANGCTASTSVTVTVNDNPNALMSKTDAHCQQSDGSATVTASGGTPPYSYHWNTNATTSTINNIPAGTYSVTVTDDKGCEAYGSITVNDLSGPDVTATASPSEICEGFDSDLNATATGGTSPYTYSWDNGLGSGADKTVSPGVTTTYHVTVTDANGCTASTSVTVTVNDNPNALMSKTDAHCQQSDGSATVTASGGTPPYSYHWNTNATTSTINDIPAGTYSVTVTDDKGCEAYGSIAVNDLSGPDVTATASPTEICEGYDSDLHATATGGTSPYTYSWDHGLGSGADKTVSPAATTTYHVTVTDANGCIASTSVTVTVNDNPNALMSKTDAHCQQSDGSATVTASGGTPPYSYHWNTNATTSTINNIPAGTYSVTVTDDKGCEAYGSITVNDLSGPNVTATASPTEICKGYDSDLHATATGGTSPYTYSWDHGLGNGADKTVSPAATTTYHVTVTDVYGCTASTSVTVTVNDNPNALMSKTDAHCQQSDGSATVTASGGTPPYSYHWNTNATTSTINNIPAGTYSVTVTDDKGCEAYGSITVNDLSGPDVNITGITTICNSQSTTITAVVSGGTAPYSYLWNHGLSDNPSHTVSPSVTTTYTVTIVDANGCEANDEITIIVESCEDIQHQKILKEIVQTGPRSFRVDYEIKVNNNGMSPGVYNLEDEEGFDDDVEIQSVNYTSDVAGNPGSNLNVTGPWTLANSQSINIGEIHTYVMHFFVKLDLKRQNPLGDNIYTACESGASGDPDFGEGLYNQSKLDTDNDGQWDEFSEACGDLPFVTHEKYFDSVEQTGLGTWNVNYHIVVRNLGGASGKYNLSDDPDFDDDIEIISSTFTSDAPGVVGGNLYGTGPWYLGTDVGISAGSVHNYYINVSVSMDLDNPSTQGDGIYSACELESIDNPQPGNGLFNESYLDVNDDGTYDETDKVCGDLPYITHEKELSGIVQTGADTWEVTYDISVKNRGGATGTYDLWDIPGFDNDIEILQVSHEVVYNCPTGAASGSLLLSPYPWQLENNRSLAPGEEDCHTMKFIVKMDLNSPSTPGDGIYNACESGTTGDPTFGEGLYNQSKLDINDDGVFDEYKEACGDLPYITHEKTIGDIIQTGGHTWEVHYHILVKNEGGDAGTYNLTDNPGFDDDIEILSSSYTSDAPGVIGGNLFGTGPWYLGTDVNIEPGEVHNYEIVVGILMDLESADTPGDGVYKRCESNDPGDPQQGEGLYNQSKIDVDDNGTWDEYSEACGDLPSLHHEKTLLSIVQTGAYTYQVKYNIIVTNDGGADGKYNLEDEPKFENDIAILEASYTSDVPGNPGNGLGINNPGPYELASDQSIVQGEVHTYTLTIDVLFDLNNPPPGGDGFYTKCESTNPGNPVLGEGLYNLSKLDTNDDGIWDEYDEACGDLPFITHEKTIADINQTGSGTWEIHYNILVKNIGGESGFYNLMDNPDFDDDIRIDYASYTTDVSGETGGSLSGNGPWYLASGIHIGAGQVHNYEIIVGVSMDLESGNTPGDGIYNECEYDSNEQPQQGKGLFNQSKIDVNDDGIWDEDSKTCGDLPNLHHEKTLLSIVEIGAHTYQVKYNIHVTNDGGSDGRYNLEDHPGFDNDIIILGASYTSDAPGNSGHSLTSEGNWTLAEHQLIGAGDDHIYILTVNVFFDLNNGAADGDGVYANCDTDVPGNPDFGKGLYNQSKLDIDDDGIWDEFSETCGDLPFITHDKIILKDPVELENGNFQVEYEISVWNLGGAEGTYSLKDIPEFDDDVTIVNVSYNSSDGGQNGNVVSPGVLPWVLATNHNIGPYPAGHTYRLYVEVSIDLNDGIGDDKYDYCYESDNEIGAGKGLFNRSLLYDFEGDVIEKDSVCTDAILGKIGDFVFYDRDQDGYQDSFDPGFHIDGRTITVELLNSSQIVIKTTTVDENGYYEFDNLPAGNYYVRFIKPDGYYFSIKNNPADDSKDSDADEYTGLSDLIVLGPGEINLTIDAGLQASPALTDPCICLDNATEKGNGQFNEVVRITGYPDEVWTIVSQTGMYWRQPISPEPPAAPVPVPVGTTMQHVSPGSELFQLEFLHVDQQGYSIVIENGYGAQVSVNNVCEYPTIDYLSYTETICNTDPPFPLTGTANVPADVKFFYNGEEYTELDPAVFGVGDFEFEVIIFPFDTSECLAKELTPVFHVEDCGGNVTHHKELVGVERIGENYEATYQIIVNNNGQVTSNYDLFDETGFDDDISILSVSYTTDIPGQSGGNLSGSGPWQLADNQSISGGETQIYTIAVVVTMDLNSPVTPGDGVYTPCGTSIPGDPVKGEGLYNQSMLDFDDDGIIDEYSEACGDIPFITHNKEIESIVKLSQGNWEVTYHIQVKNLGGELGQYNLVDEPRFDDDINIEYASFTSDAPGISGGTLTGYGPWTLGEDVNIDIGDVHDYTITVGVSMDLDSPNTPGDGVYTKCGTELCVDPRIREGLLNLSYLDTNDDWIYEEQDQACGDLPNLHHEKTLLSVVQTGTHTYDVNYSIVVVNDGGTESNYSLEDVPGFDNDVVILGASYTSDAPGNNGQTLPLNGTWNLASNQSIGEGEQHNYQVTIQIKLDLSNEVPGGDGIYNTCESGSSTFGEGLFNQSRLDVNGDGTWDEYGEACGDIPFITHIKTVKSAPVKLSNRTFKVEYEIEVHNYGTASGTYSLFDAPAFDDDISILSVSYTTDITGQSGGNLSGYGPWQLADNQSISGGETQIYTIVVIITMDLNSPVTPGDGIYTACGTSVSGDPVKGEGLYNQSQLDINDDGTIDEYSEACGDIPFITHQKEIEDIVKLSPGNWEVTYHIYVKNLGGESGKYNLVDEPRFDDDVIINNTSYTSNAPGVSGSDLTGYGPWTLGEDVNIGVGEIHDYVITVDVSMDLNSPDTPGDGVYTQCKTELCGDPRIREGLLNISFLDIDDDWIYDEQEQACGDFPALNHEKTLMSIEPTGDYTYDVKYNILVNNDGGIESEYTLEDDPGFDNDIVILGASYTSNAVGNSGQDLSTNGPWTLASNQSIGTGVQHSYIVTVHVKLDLNSEVPGGDGIYNACDSGDPAFGKGLFNQSKLDIDSDGSWDEYSEVCEDLPFITHTKSVKTNPATLCCGKYKVEYEIKVFNKGGASGTYNLVDEPDFDDDITIVSASYSTDIAGESGGDLSGSGPWQLATDQSISNGEIQIYTISVVVTMDLSSPLTQGDGIYTACDTDNPSGKGLFNQSRLDINNDGIFDEYREVCADIPFITHEKQIDDIVKLSQGNWEVTYHVFVRNLGTEPGIYNLVDDPAFDDDIKIEYASYVSDAPDVTGSSLIGNGPWTLGEDVNIAAGQVHDYVITIGVSMDLNDPDTPGDGVYSGCGTGICEDPQRREGLLNRSFLDTNDDWKFEETDQACGDLEIVDLALTMQSIYRGPFDDGDLAYFAIDIYNQGNITMDSVDIINYMPRGFGWIENINQDWNYDGTNSSYTLTDPISPGESETVYVIYTVNNDVEFNADDFIIYAEITGMKDEYGVDRSTEDIDSDPGSNSAAELSVKPDDPDDNNIFGKGSAYNEDEDDHDPAKVYINNIAAIGNYVWEDKNGDGIQDSNENGINGIIVTLFDYTGLPVASTVTGVNQNTGEDGYYEFLNLLPGFYYVCFNKGTFDSFSPKQIGGNSTIDSDADPVTGCTELVFLTPGIYDNSIDAGLFNNASIGDFVWIDNNNNGIQDPDESGINDMPVKLYEDFDEDGIPDGDFIASQLTSTYNGKDGYYRFDDLLPGNYIVEFVNNAGYDITIMDAGNDDALDSDVNPETGFTDNISLISGQFNSTVDAGYFYSASVGDYVWYDKDGDGIQESNEDCFNNVKVILYRVELNTKLDTIKVDSTVSHEFIQGGEIKCGYYKFDKLKPGNYFMVFENPDNKVYTVSPKGKLFNPGKDSDINPDGKTDMFSLLPGENNNSIDAGFYKGGCVEGYVWNELDYGDPVNKQDVRDPSDATLPDILVELYIEKQDNDSLVRSTYTDENGHYSFDNIEIGSYHSVVYVDSLMVVKTDVGDDDSVDNDFYLSEISGLKRSNSFSVLAYDARGCIEHIDAGLYYPTLPIVLLNFDAEWNDNDKVVDIQWDVESEINFDYYLLERKSELEKEFSVLKKVYGKEGRGEKSYFVTDAKVNGGITYYYRLRSVDLDGSMQLSDIRNVIIPQNGFNVKAYPNPAKDKLDIFINGIEKDVRIKIFDEMGRQAMQDLSIKDSNRSNEKVELDISNLPQGQYYIKVISGQNVKLMKIIHFD